MGNPWEKINNVPVKKENSDPYSDLLNKVKEIYEKFTLDSEDMEIIFNEKYGDSGVVQLLDEKGEALTDLDGKRIEPVEFSDIDGHSKQVHIRGLLYKFTLNPLNLADNLEKETALLNILKINGVDLGQMIKKCKRNNQE